MRALYETVKPVSRHASNKRYETAKPVSLQASN